jgi:hypothetical protein
MQANKDIIQIMSAYKYASLFRERLEIDIQLSSSSSGDTYSTSHSAAHSQL